MTRPRALVGPAVPLVLLLVLFASAPARAAADEAASDDDPAAMAALQHAVLAAATLAYSGTQLVSSWSAGGTLSRIVRIQRTGDDVRWESYRTAAGPDDTGAGSSALLSTSVGGLRLSTAALSVLAMTHTLSVAGHEPVAGRQATLVQANRQGRPAARLWVDDVTGLLLRQEILDGDGNLMRMSAFIDVQVGRPAGSFVPRSVGPRAFGPLRPVAVAPAGPSGTIRNVGLGPTPASPQAEQIGVAGLTTAQLDALRASGWACPQAPSADLRLIDARWVSGNGAARALHLTYTDGISGVSVFIQRGRLDAAGLGGYDTLNWDGAQVRVARDWPTRLVWQGGGQVMTVVADAPVEEVRGVVIGFPHDPPQPDEGFFGGLSSALGGMMERLPG